MERNESIKKTSLIVTLSFLLCLFLSSSVFATTNNNSFVDNNKTVTFTRNMAFYNAEFGKYVIPFIKVNGAIVVLTKEQEELSNVSQIITSLDTIEARINGASLSNATTSQSSIVTPQGTYYEYYQFTPTLHFTYIGSTVKASPDVVGPCDVTKSVSKTTSAYFSASLTAEKSAIKAGCGFIWVNTASSSTSYTANLAAGESGYLAFKPYYNAVKGTLKKYSNYGTLLTSKTATGFSVKKLSNGEADGQYFFVYY